MKTCNRCDQSKALDEFYKDSRAKDCLRRICKSCDKAAASSYKSRMSDSMKSYAAEYRAKNKEYFAEKMREFRQKNPEYYAKWVDENRDRERARWRASYYANPVKARNNEAKRRAAKLRAVPAWADMEDIKNVYAEARHAGMTVDHIVPLRSKFVCGLHVWENLQLLPNSQNFSKGNRIWPDMPALLENQKK